MKNVFGCNDGSYIISMHSVGYLAFSFKTKAQFIYSGKNMITNTYKYAFQ